MVKSLGKIVVLKFYLLLMCVITEYAFYIKRADDFGLTDMKVHNNLFMRL